MISFQPAFRCASLRMCYQQSAQSTYPYQHCDAHESRNLCPGPNLYGSARARASRCERALRVLRSPFENVPQGDTDGAHAVQRHDMYLAFSRGERGSEMGE